MEGCVINRSKALEQAQSIIVASAAKSLDEVVLIAPDPKPVVVALLYALGFPYVRYDTACESVNFVAGHSPDSLALQMTVRNHNDLTGPLVDVLRRVYIIAEAIQNELHEAIYMPSSTKRAVIDSVVHRAGGDEELYATVLRNWSV